VSGAASQTVPATAEPVIPLLEYQRRDVESPARFMWCCWSRQIGKSFTKALRRILRGIDRRRTQVFLSASETQSRELMMKVRQHCEALHIATRFLDSETFEGTSFKQLTIELPNGVRVIGLPANPRTARGFTGDVFLDEFAMHQDDRGIWAALFPTVMRGEGELDIASTPKGKDNIFYRLADNPKFQHSTVTIHDAVRDGLDADPEELRLAIGDEELWRQEFLCEFVDEATAFLTYEMIAACEDSRLPAPLVIHGDQERALDPLDAVIASIDELGECYLGVDVGRRRDLTVWWLGEKSGRELVTRMVVELAKTRFRAQYEKLSAILAHRNVRRAAIDETGLGMQMAEAAQEDFGKWRVDAVTFTPAVKAKLAGQLRVKVEDRLVRIPSSQAIRNDWHSLEKIVTTGGSVLYRAERTPGGHADRFWAAALAVDAAGVNEQPWRGEVQTVGRSRWQRRSDPEDAWEQRFGRRRRLGMAGV